MQADQINCLKILEIWGFGLALVSRQRPPVSKRTIWCVFVGVLCSFDFCPNSNFIAGRTVFILTNGCNSNLNPPHTPKTPIKQRVLFTYHLFLARFYDKISSDTGDCAGRYNHPKYACMELDGEQHDQTETIQQNNDPAQDIVGILF